MQRLIALDVSSAVVGWCIIENQEIIAANEFALNIPTTDKHLLFARALIEIIVKYNPTHAILEATFLGPNINTVKVLERYRGIAILLLLAHDVEILHEANAATIRKSVFGYGNLKKSEVAEAINKHLGKNYSTKGYDTTDAIALALFATNQTIPMEQK